MGESLGEVQERKYFGDFPKGVRNVDEMNPMR